jgi:hypothetical protein
MWFQTQGILCHSQHNVKLNITSFKQRESLLLPEPPREFAGPGASLLWGPHDIIIFKADPSQSPKSKIRYYKDVTLDVFP